MIPWQVANNNCRLEAATSRLEDMAASSPGASTDPNGATLVASQRNTPAASSPTLPAPTALASTLPSLPPVIEGFDEFLDQDVKKFVSLSEQIGEPVSVQVSR